MTTRHRDIVLPQKGFRVIGGLIYDPIDGFESPKSRSIEPCSRAASAVQMVCPSDCTRAHPDRSGPMAGPALSAQLVPRADNKRHFGHRWTAEGKVPGVGGLLTPDGGRRGSIQPSG